MRLFGRRKKKAGWMAISFEDDAVLVAHIEPAPAGRKPVVTLARSFAAAKQTWAMALEKLDKELHVAGYSCTTALRNGEYQLLLVDAPNVPQEEWKTAIRWRLKDMLDFRVEEAAIDVLDVPPDPSVSGRSHSMYVIAARNQVIQQRQALFSDLKLPLSVIDVTEMAQRNISALAATQGQGLAMLSFDDQGGLLTVTYSDELYLSRRIDIPLSSLMQSGADHEANRHDRILLELQRSLDHFDRQYHFIPVPRLALAPLGEEGDGLLAYLNSNLYIPVEALDLESILDISAASELQKPQAQQRYFTALGCALRNEEKVL